MDEQTQTELSKEELIAANKAADAEAGNLPEEPTDPLDTKEVQIAAGQYAQLVKQIRSRAKQMKAGGLGRVLIAVAEFPFAESYPKFRIKEEQELFLLMVSNGKAKGIIGEALKSQEKQLEQEAAANVADEILTKGKL